MTNRQIAVETGKRIVSGSAGSKVSSIAMEKHDWNPFAAMGLGIIVGGVTYRGLGKVDKVVSKVRNIGKLEVKMVEAISIDRNETYYGYLMVSEEKARYSNYWRERGIGSDNTWEAFLEANPSGRADDYFKLIKDQSPWPQGYNPMDNIITMKERNTFKMVLDNEQPLTKPGGFGILEDVPNVEFARNDMAIKSNWKVDCGKVATYRVKQGVELNILSGPIGPQIDLKTDKYLLGNSSITQLDLFNGLGNVDRNNYIEYVPGSLRKLN